MSTRMLELLRRQRTHLQADTLVLVGVRGAVAALLTAVRVADLSAADLSAAERTAFPSFTLPVQSARRAAHFCTVTRSQHQRHRNSKTFCE